MNSLDIIVEQYFSVVRTTGLTEFMYLLSVIFDVSIASLLICICVAIIIYIVRGKRHSILFSIVMVSQAVIVYAFKVLFNVSRPAGAVLEAFGKSFPSYHATVATVFFVMLMYIFDNKLKPFARIVFNIFCVSMIILVASSRLYLGVHWFSDVLAGIVLGVAIVYLSVYIFNKIK